MSYINNKKPSRLFPGLLISEDTKEEQYTLKICPGCRKKWLKDRSQEANLLITWQSDELKLEGLTQVPVCQRCKRAKERGNLKKVAQIERNLNLMIDDILRANYL